MIHISPHRESNIYSEVVDKTCRYVNQKENGGQIDKSSLMTYKDDMHVYIWNEKLQIGMNFTVWASPAF